MNYYIQGSPARAEEIKAAFEKLGYNSRRLDFSDGFFYTVERDVHYCVYDYMVNIIKTHPDYKELELPVEFKDGDIIGFNDCTHNDGSYIDWVGIYKQEIETNQHLFHCVIPSCRSFRVGGMWRVFTAYPATKEQRDLLFAKMKEAGYEWDADKKELKKIQPHYGISNFYAGMPVLVRNSDNNDWDYVTFSHLNRYSLFIFRACGDGYKQCIPFNKDTKHLLGTTDPCEEQYVNW